MSEVARLEAELELARKCETLEAAREAMHADRNEQTIAAYQEACNEVAAARAAYREEHRPTTPVEPGDGIASPETVEVSIGVEQP